MMRPGGQRVFKLNRLAADSQSVIIDRDFTTFADQAYRVSPRIRPPSEKNLRLTARKSERECGLVFNLFRHGSMK